VCNATILQIRYTDSMNETESVRFRVYEDVNQSALFDNTYYRTSNDTSNLTITINGLNCSYRYGIRASVEHDTLGNSPVEFTLGAGGFGALIDLGLSAWIYQAISMVILTVVALITTPKLRFASLIVMAGLIGIFYYAGWFTASAMVMALLIIFIVLSVIYEVRRGGMT